MENCLARLDQLARGHYLERELVDVRGKTETVYYLATKARRAFSDAERRGFYKKTPSKTELRHTLWMGEVLDAFGPRLVRFLGEHQLKSMKGRGTGARGPGARDAQVPDGYIEIARPDGQTVGFSIEIDGAYHGERLRRKIDALGVSPSPVLWVTFTPGRLQTLRAATARQPRITPILFDDLTRL